MPAVTVTSPAPVAVPLIRAGVHSSVFSPLSPWPEPPTATTGFELNQAWRDTPEPDFQSGHVRVGALNHELAIWADLTGSPLSQVNDADHDHLWERGDVFECFIQAAGETAYQEYHIAPNGSTTQLAFPGEWDRTAGIAPFVRRPPSLRARTVVESDRWRVFVLIPLPPARTFSSPLQGEWKLSFGRYAHRRTGPPVISNSAPHAEADFHRRHEWTPIHIVSRLP